MRGGWDALVLCVFVCCAVTLFARYNVTAAALRREWEGAVPRGHAHPDEPGHRRRARRRVVARGRRRRALAREYRSDAAASIPWCCSTRSRLRDGERESADPQA